MQEQPIFAIDVGNLPAAITTKVSVTQPSLMERYVRSVLQMLHAVDPQRYCSYINPASLGKISFKITMTTLETLSMAYATLVVITHKNPQLANNNQHRNFIYIGTMALLGATIEALRQAKKISEHHHHLFEKVNTAAVGAAVAAIFAENIYYPDNPPNNGVPEAMEVGLCVEVPLLLAKLVVELLQQRHFFQTRLGRYLSRGLRSIYSIFNGAGSMDMLTSLATGLGLPISNNARLGMAVGAGIGHVVADFPLAKKAEDNTVGRGYKPAVLYASLLLAIEMACLLATLAFDIYVDDENSNKLKSWVFYFILSLSALMGSSILYNKYTAETKDVQPGRESQPLLPRSTPVENTGFSLSSVLMRCCPFLSQSRTKKPVFNNRLVLSSSNNECNLGSENKDYGIQ